MTGSVLGWACWKASRACRAARRRASSALREDRPGRPEDTGCAREFRGWGSGRRRTAPSERAQALAEYPVFFHVLVVSLDRRAIPTQPGSASLRARRRPARLYDKLEAKDVQHIEHLVGAQRVLA